MSISTGSVGPAEVVERHAIAAMLRVISTEVSYHRSRRRLPEVAREFEQPVDSREPKLRWLARSLPTHLTLRPCQPSFRRMKRSNEARPSFH
jgi:hypothetical protein